MLARTVNEPLPGSWRASGCAAYHGRTGERRDDVVLSASYDRDARAESL